MKRIGLLALAAIFVATAVHAGEPARGKVCDCDPEAFGRPTGAGLNNGDAEASNDWALGGNTIARVKSESWTSGLRGSSHRIVALDVRPRSSLSSQMAAGMIECSRVF